MKTICNNRFLKKVAGRLRVIMLMAAMFIPALSMAQGDTMNAKPAGPADTVSNEAPAQEGPELIAPGIAFTCIQKADNSLALKAVVQAKVKGSFIKLPLLKVLFVQVTDSGDKELGYIITDGRGVAQYTCKPEHLILDKEGKFHVKAVFAGNKSMDAAEEELSFKKARLEITPVKEDSAYSVLVKLVDVSSGKEVPVKEATVGLFVQRMFNPLKVGEGATDEAGEVTVEFPAQLPGDAKGNLTIMARLDENEIYGNLEATAVQQWGVPVSDKIEDQPRALWSVHPPLWMLITFIVLMVTVWGHYIVIIFELFRLRKEQPKVAGN